ncbi:TetR/AcrR family transcriptional regulator [Amycolatopsis rhizosphaerae]|uniref:TetR/AcrR family transcriptional regulator n=1 Tax=Amycolatopsis rhizosphaerae TaxID=2053003 RepID=A0A558CKY0_9PSEU|nr:TetR/AcrR family transcriptional regulator [Amycolatopsis rhizosphaerae]TVT49428.1 TetR/AcrR family transcriptional regulator [Amycolatopsis rhizosphaerae]
MTEVPARAMRADARRNYERLLGEAKRAFAEQGIDASLEEIARRAGVGIGTLYRHFPTREALLEALLSERFDAQAAGADELMAHPSPIDGLRMWALRLAEMSMSYRGLVEATAAALANESSQLYRSCHAMQEGASRLVTRALEAGQLRADVTALEVLLLVNSSVWAAERAPDGTPSLARLVDLVFLGLRAR